MGRVLKITSGLIGILLLLITGSLMGRPNRNQPLQFMLVRVSNQNTGLGYQQFYWVEPNLDITRPASLRHDHLSFVGLTSEWMYYTTTDYNRTSGSPESKLYRIQPAAASNRQVVADDLPACWDGCGMMMTQEQEFVIPTYTNYGSGLQLYRAQLGGLERLAVLDSSIPFQYIPPNFTLVDEWVVFNGTPLSSTSFPPTSQVYRIPMTGGSASNLTPNMADATIVYWPPDETTGVVANVVDGNLYQVSLDANQPPHHLTMSGHDWASVAAWLQKSRILIVQSAAGSSGGEWLAAVQWDTQQVLWEAVVGYGAVSSDEHRVVVIGLTFTPKLEVSGTELVEIQTINGQRRVITQMQGSFIREVWGWTGDGAWLLFTTYAANVNNITLWRVAAAGGHAQKVVDISASAIFEGWTADGMSAIYTEYAPTHENFSFQIHVDDTHPQRLIPNHPEFRSIEFLTRVTVHPRRFQPEILLVAGGGLCLIAFVPYRRRKRTKV